MPAPSASDRAWAPTPPAGGTPPSERARPAYAVASVDHALQLAALLQAEGSITVSHAAARLGVAVSTAHRLLAMLVYRDFAVQGPDRRYHAGPVLAGPSGADLATAALREAAVPQLARLAATLGESANVIVRVRDTAAFVASAESPHALRVGNREGMVFPAHRVTGGLVLLAELDSAELDALYAAPDCLERPNRGWLTGQLRRVRHRGYAVNQGLSEKGVHAIGVLLRHPEDHRALAGVSVSMPSVRYASTRLPHLVTALHSTAEAIARTL